MGWLLRTPPHWGGGAPAYPKTPAACVGRSISCKISLVPSVPTQQPGLRKGGPRGGGSTFFENPQKSSSPALALTPPAGGTQARPGSDTPQLSKIKNTTTHNCRSGRKSCCIGKPLHNGSYLTAHKRPPAHRFWRSRASARSRWMRAARRAPPLRRKAGQALQKNTKKVEAQEKSNPLDTKQEAEGRVPGTRNGLKGVLTRGASYLEVWGYTLLLMPLFLFSVSFTSNKPFVSARHLHIKVAAQLTNSSMKLHMPPNYTTTAHHIWGVRTTRSFSFCSFRRSSFSYAACTRFARAAHAGPHSFAMPR